MSKTEKHLTVNKRIVSQRKEKYRSNLIYVPKWWFEGNGIAVGQEFIVDYETKTITVKKA